MAVNIRVFNLAFLSICYTAPEAKKF